ncbi:MAG: tetratricopeptide repeat protein [Spirochaetaceae bacterium]|nr:tetratricopeptide repeat protein [Spirochaetaceae bacterium]
MYFLKRNGGILVCLLLLCGGLPLFGQSAFQKGEELFMQNRPQEAAGILEGALAQEPRNEKIYLYLGIIYEQLGIRQKAVDIMQKGLEVTVFHKADLFFNIGNNYDGMGEAEKAVEMYTRALETNGSLGDAYLNRANVEVKLDRLTDALRDYRLYLVMAPASPQRPQIERMIQLIESVEAERAAEAERVRIAEEQRRIREEEEKRLEEERRKQEEEDRRIAEEKRRQEEEARQKALLDEVLKSLQMSAEDAAHLSAEKESIIENREDVDIDD